MNGRYYRCISLTTVYYQYTVFMLCVCQGPTSGERRTPDFYKCFCDLSNGVFAENQEAGGKENNFITTI